MSESRPIVLFSDCPYWLPLENLEPRVLLSGNPDLWPLPLPDENIADLPIMQPSVVTAGGQRLLLSYFNNNVSTDDDVVVSFDARTNRLVSNKPGWWIINYPLDQIRGLVNINSPASVNNPSGLTDTQIKNLVAQDLFGPGQTADAVRNWYIMTPVDADHPLATEPGEPTGPAPIVPTDLSNCYVLVVDADTSHVNPTTNPWVASRLASAQNVIVDATTYRTITSALARIPNDGHYNSAANAVTMKTVVLVAPGTYRETVYDNSTNGTANYPLIFEGVRDANGNMPTISGATVFANNSWTLQSVLGDVNVSGENVYRATIPSTASDWDTSLYQRIGPVAANDITFVQRSNPAYLQEGEAAYNIGSTQFLNMYGMEENSSLTAVPNTGQTAATATVPFFLSGAGTTACNGRYVEIGTHNTYGSGQSFPLYRLRNLDGTFANYWMYFDTDNPELSNLGSWVISNNSALTDAGAQGLYYYPVPQPQAGYSYSPITTTPVGTWKVGTGAASAIRNEGRYLSFEDFAGSKTNAQNKVFWVDTWVWVPQPSGCGYLSDGLAHFQNNNFTYGPFRAAPHTQRLNDQANPYRMWVNGQAAGQIWNSEGDVEQDSPHPDARGYQPIYSSADNPIEDDWVNLDLKIGWNHLVFQFDTSVACRYQGSAYATNPAYSEAPYWQQALRFNFTFGGCGYISGIYSQATQPADLNVGPTNPTLYNNITSYNILGAFTATTPDNGVYVRPTSAQSPTRNPNTVTTELASRTAAFATEWSNGQGNYIQLRGFNCRYGGVYLTGAGTLIEGNYMRDSGFSFNNNRDITYRNNGYTYSTSDGNYINITNGSSIGLVAGDILSLNAVDPGAAPSYWVGPAMPSPLLAGHAYFLGANQTGTNKWMVFATKADALAGTNWIVLTQATNGSGTLTLARHTTAEAPEILLNNWSLNGTWGDNCAPCTFFDAVNQNTVDANGVLDLPGHARTIFEYNRIINYNPKGMWYGWDWAAMGKGFGAVQNVYAYNVWDGGTGLGVWLDTDALNCRFEGNLFLNIDSAAINVEASPGPSLIANNIITSVYNNSGGDIAAWSSNRDWTVNNTLVRGEGFYAAINLNTSENGQRFSPWNDPDLGNVYTVPVWYDHLDARQAYVNNLFMNISVAMSPDTNPSTPDTVLGNYTNNAADITVNPFYTVGQDATAHYLSDSQMALADPENGDYRLTAGSWLNNLGASSAQVWVKTVGGVETYMDVLSLVTHDFYGLLRFVSDGSSVGATRSAHAYSGSTAIEAEFANGGMQRLEDWHPSGTMLSALTFAAPTVSLAVTDSQASELGNTGAFTVTRTGATVLPLLVRYTVSGTASNGIDYSKLSGLVTIPSGSTTAAITVAPVDSSFTNGETVTVTLVAANDASTVYSLSGNSTSSISLSRNSGLIARWKLDEASGTHAADASGNGLSATLTGDGAWNANGYLNGGLTLDGAAQYATVPDNINFDFSASSAFSLSAWVRCTSDLANDTTYFPILSHGQSTSYWELSLRGNGSSTYNGVYLQVNNVVLKPSTDQSSVFGDNAWHLVAASRDAAGNGSLYIDGALVGTATGMNVNTTNASALEIGRCGTAYFPGSLDDVRIYGRVIGAAEASALYNATTVRIAATDNYASTLGNTGTFTVTRTGSTALPLTVYYTVSGSGTTNGVSYVSLPGNVTIPAGESNATITVQAIDPYIGSGGTVVLTLADDPNLQYELGRPLGNATVALAGENNLLANWKFDRGTGSVALNSGTGGSSFDGTLLNGATWGSGQLNGGLVLDGVNDYVRVASNTTMNNALNFGTGGFTLSANVKLNLTDDFDYVTYPILSIGNEGSTQLVISLTSYNGYEWTLGMMFQTFGTSFSQLCPLPDVSNIFRDHQWHTVTVTRETDNLLHFYVDGSPVLINLGGGQGRVQGYSLFGPSWNIANVSGDLTIGTDGGKYFKGSIDNVLIYNRALTSSEVRTLADPPVVTIQTTSEAAEPSTPGAFTIHTSYATDHAITVYYTISGTATAGVDYTPFTSNVTIPAGQTSATVSFTPFYDEVLEGTETVQVTLSNSTDYAIGNYGSEANTAMMTLTDYDYTPLAQTDNPTLFVNSGWNFIDVLANDKSRYIPAGTISLTSVDAASHGTVQMIDNLVRYKPADGYVGTDSFTYTITDSKGGTATGLVNISVLDPADPRLKVWLVAQPVLSGEYSVEVWAQIPNGMSGQAISDMSVTISTPYTSGVTAPKQTTGPLKYVSTVWNPQVAANYYTLNAAPFDIDGDGDTDSYQMSLGSSGSVPDFGLSPVLLATQTWIMQSNQFVPLVVDIVPTSRYWNADGSTRTTFSYFEGIGTLVGITPPTAVADNYTIQEDTPTSLNVLANDTGSGTLRVVAVGTASHGTVTFTDTSVLYSPAANYYGTDSFTYQVTNESGITDIATVSMTINNVNDPPTAVTDSATVNVNSLDRQINVLANDTWAPDPGPETLTVVGLGRASHGVARLVNGLVLYTPSADYVGSDSFTYNVSDGLGGVTTGTVNVTVSDPPTTRLKVWLVPAGANNGDYYTVEIWAQVVHGVAGEGISDLAVTIYSPGTVGQTIPKTSGVGGKYASTTWGPDLPSDAFKILPTASDYDGDTDLDAVQFSIGDTGSSGYSLGLTPILLATQTWKLVSGMPQLAVTIATSSRHWTAGGGKTAFTSTEAQGALAGIWPRGDVNHDNLVNAADIDALFAHYGTNLQYDLNYDGIVNKSDVDELVQQILRTNYGDANLDGFIDFLDFQAMLDHWQGEADWATADFNGDLMSDFLDFQILLDYWNPTGTASAAANQGESTQTVSTVSTATPLTTAITTSLSTGDVASSGTTSTMSVTQTVSTSEVTPLTAASQAPVPAASSQMVTSPDEEDSQTQSPSEDGIVNLLSPLYKPVLTA